MGSTLARPVVLAALRTKILAHPMASTFLAAAPAILGGGRAVYSEGDVPELAAYPVLTMQAREAPANTMGAVDLPKWGSAVEVTLKAITQERNTDKGDAILNWLMDVLNGRELVVSGYARTVVLAGPAVEPYHELLRGTLYHHHPSLWSVNVHQGA